MSTNDMDYYEKYLKYKNKYLELKNQIGSGDVNINRKFKMFYNSSYRSYIRILKPKLPDAMWNSQIKMDDVLYEDGIFTFQDGTTHTKKELQITIPRAQYNMYFGISNNPRRPNNSLLGMVTSNININSLFKK